MLWSLGALTHAAGTATEATGGRARARQAALPEPAITLIASFICPRRFLAVTWLIFAVVAAAAVAAVVHLIVATSRLRRVPRAAPRAVLALCTTVVLIVDERA